MVFVKFYSINSISEFDKFFRFLNNVEKNYSIMYKIIDIINIK